MPKIRSDGGGNPSGVDKSKFSGELTSAVQVNFTREQKAFLVKKASELGVPLATLIRLKVLEAYSGRER